MEAKVENVDSAENSNEGMSLSVENSVSPEAVKNCNLCGSSTPAVRCDKCGSQTFCLSCDDMYHRHPKRRFHLRKAVDSIWNSHRSPRFRRRTELPGDPSKIPIPPPRTKKRHSSSDFGNMFRTNFQVPAFKGYWPQKKSLDLKNQELSDKSASPISPEPGYENATADTNGMKNGMPDKSTDNALRSLQRRSSADSPIFNANASSPTNIFSPGTLPMQVDPQGRNTPGFMQQYPGHGMHHSMSTADLNTSSPQPIHPMYPFPPHMHPFFPPHLNPYAAPMAPFNCPQCVSASWSNLMSAGMAQYHQHHHVSPQMVSPHTGTLRAHSPSPEAFMKQNANYQGQPYSNVPAVQSTHAKPDEGATADAAHNDVHHTPPPPPPASPLSNEIQNAVSEEQRGQQQQLQQILQSDEEMDEAEGDEQADDDAPAKIPEKPTEPWTCVHCTYINPPGSHICDVCCKTSYNISSASDSGSKRKRKKKQAGEKPAGNAAVASDEAGPSNAVTVEKVK